MAKGLIGKKIGMSQVFTESGDIVPVTVLQLGPCAVSQVKTPDKDGYSAVQLAFGDVKESRINKAEKQHLAKANLGPKKYLKEFQGYDGLEAGNELKVSDVFNVQDTVKVTSVSKGKGFQGVVKRYGHHGGPASHGSRNHRLPGSIGACATPSRVFKGVKLPGRMGGKKTTVRNLKIVQVMPEENLIFVSGSVPGAEKSVLTVEKLG